MNRIFRPRHMSLVAAAVALVIGDAALAQEELSEVVVRLAGMTDDEDDDSDPSEPIPVAAGRRSAINGARASHVGGLHPPHLVAIIGRAATGVDAMT